MYDLKLLGGSLLVGEEGPLTGPETRRHSLALLALLATAPSRTLSRVKVLGLLWPDARESAGRNRLSSCLYHLRRGLGRASLVSAGDDLRLNPGAVSCDVWSFEDGLERGALAAAVELYTGPFLDGFYLDGSVPFERWTERERGRLQRSYWRALEKLAEEAEAEGRATAALRWWRERQDEDPLDSRVTARLIRALAAVGNRADALRSAESHARRLEEELGAEPDPDVRALVDSLRTTAPAGDAEAQTREVAPGAGARARDLSARSIAVLPFQTLGDADGIAFSEGIHGGILTRLSRIAGLDVIARTSVRRYRQTEKAISEIGRELSVTWVLEGEVQESTPEFRVNVRLVEAASNRQVWAREYTGVLSENGVFRTQAEITKKIAGSLEVEVTPDQRRRIERRPTASLDAYRLFARGRMHLERRTREEMERALSCFERVVELDPGYARARVGLADAVGLLHAYGHVEADEALPRAEAAIRKALELDPTSAEAHAALARYYGQRKQALAAQRELEVALELEPSYADAHSWLSVGDHVLGRRRAALESARRAVALDPLSPEAVCNLALSCLINGLHEQALEEARYARELVPEYATGDFYEGLVLYEMGRFAEAAEVLRDLSLPWAGSGPRAGLALSLVALGDGAGARDLLTRIEAAGHPFDAGVVHIALGEKEEAFEAFRAVDFSRVDHRLGYWPTIAVRYLWRDVWEGIREDPRYDELLRRVGRSWGLEPDGDLAATSRSANA